MLLSLVLALHSTVFWFCAVVSTSALHGEGPRVEPYRDHTVYTYLMVPPLYYPVFVTYLAPLVAACVSCKDSRSKFPHYVTNIGQFKKKILFGL